jgi:hypothetical protein
MLRWNKSIIRKQLSIEIMPPIAIVPMLGG